MALDINESYSVYYDRNLTVKDSLSILDYKCIKATTRFRGRDYTAWVTKELPINDGPWKFYGLPGLILQIED